MATREAFPRRVGQGFAILAFVLAGFLAASRDGVSGQKKSGVLRIGTSSSLTEDTTGKKEEAAMESLKAFLKDETNMSSEIVRLKDWSEVADKMSKAELQFGVFQGYEYAWAQEKYPQLQPLALAINVYRYPTAFVVVNKDNKAKDFAGLQGQSIAIPGLAQPFLRLFLDRQAQANGKKLEAFFSKIEMPENFEVALDDVVDGKVQAVAADRSALESYKRRKPGRFEKLKEIAHSQPFPPPVVAFYDKVLDDATLKQFQEGILNSGRKEKGEMMLNLFRLTGFETAPPDFGKVLEQTRKAYPPTGK